MSESSPFSDYLVFVEWYGDQNAKGLREFPEAQRRPEISSPTCMHYSVITRLRQSKESANAKGALTHK